MRKQIIPVLLAFVLGFGLGYMYHSQSIFSSSPSNESTATKTNAAMEASNTKFEKVNLDIAKGHAKKYKKKHPHDEDPAFHTVYAVWTSIDHVEGHFEGKIKAKDLEAITPAWATGIRVYHALDDRGDLVNYLVFTDNSQTVSPQYVTYNDRHEDQVYLIANKKIDLTKEKRPRSGTGTKERLNNHVVCNPNCPDESLLI